LAPKLSLGHPAIVEGEVATVSGSLPSFPRAGTAGTVSHVTAIRAFPKPRALFPSFPLTGAQNSGLLRVDDLAVDSQGRLLYPGVVDQVV
jgi:hypothetical protein